MWLLFKLVLLKCDFLLLFISKFAPRSNLRNIKSGQKVTAVSKQQVVALEIVGALALNQELVIATQRNVVVIQISVA